eukprot:Tamp_06762.p1 GENE.Tamp_06762~~Tamp_06762.p1  ORF type:complete len:804 (+),score=154.53 Tamp_06762:157-2412(+)
MHGATTAGRPRHSWVGEGLLAGSQKRTLVVRRTLGLWLHRALAPARGAYRDAAHRLRYHVILLLEASLWMKLFVMWLLSATLVMVGASLMVASSAVPRWGDALFHAYALIHNAPGTSAWDYTGPGLFLANCLFITGMLTFAVTIGTVSSHINAALEQVWKADHKISESEHIVVLNWNQRIIPILRQLMAGRGGNPREAVVVLADQDLDMMRSTITGELGPLAKGIVVRTGNPSSISDMRKISVGRSSKILILVPDSAENIVAHGSVPGLLTTQIACIKSLQQIEAVESPRERAHTIVVVAPEEHAPAADLDFTLVSPTAFQQHVFATAALQRGLTVVYQDILDQTGGTELHLFDMVNRGCQHLHNLTISDLGQYFPQAVVLGWIVQESSASDPAGRVRMNPNRDETLPIGSSLILMSHFTISTCSQKPARPFVSASPVASATSMAAGREAARAGAVPWRPLPPSKTSKRILILNFGEQWNLLKGLDNNLLTGSQVTVVSVAGENSGPPNRSAPAGRYVTFVEVDVPGWIGRWIDRIENVRGYDIVMILEARLPDGTIIEENDARAVATMMLITQKRARELAAQPNPSDAVAAQLHFVVSVMKPSSLDVIRATAKNNNASVTSVLCDDLESGAVTQVLWNPDLMLVYNDVLHPSWGVQLDFISAESVVPLHTKMNFAYIAQSTFKMSALALGIRFGVGSRGSVGSGAHTHSGITSSGLYGRLYLAPLLDEVLILDKGDMIAIFADKLNLDTL